jgi:hypothetical protein
MDTHTADSQKSCNLSCRIPNFFNSQPSKQGSGLGILSLPVLRTFCGTLLNNSKTTDDTDYTLGRLTAKKKNIMTRIARITRITRILGKLFFVREIKVLIYPALQFALGRKKHKWGMVFVYLYHF